MKYDAIIIGTGQAGTPLSVALADHRWTVAMVERGDVGGTCVNTGCTPTKTMIHRAQVAHYAENAERWGVHASDVSADLPGIVAQKNQVVQKFRDSLLKKMNDRPNLHVFHGTAQFTGPHQVRVGDQVL